MDAKLSQEDLIEWWLKKYHNLTVSELIQQEPELIKSPAWFKKYTVTQAQHDEWEKWALSALAKQYKRSVKWIRASWAFVYLNVAPSVK